MRTILLCSIASITFCISLGFAAEQSQCSTKKIEVINNGIGGQNSNDILNRFLDILKAKPDTIILMVGTNDSLNSSKPVTLEQFTANLKKISDLARTEKITLILVTIPPCYGKYVLMRHPAQFFAGQTPEEKTKIYNSAIKAFAAKEGIPVLDIYRIFMSIGNVGLEKDSLIRNSENSNAQDGIHPTPYGYKIMATALYGFMESQQLKPEKISCVGDSITFGVHVKGEGTSTGQTYPAWLSALYNYN
jgi:lysophospholipase L1-like esterase